MDMQNGSISLIIAQGIILVNSALLYLRQRQKADSQGRDVGTWANKISEAVGIAQQAMSHVDKIDTEHYRALKNKYEALVLEFDDLKRAFRALEERYERLKLDKAAEAKAESRAAKKTPPAVPPEPGDESASLDALIRSGQAIPLATPNGAPVTHPARSTFGQPAH